MLLITMAAAAIFIIDGCRYGAAVESFPPARTPKGVIGTITTTGARFSAAELIEVRESEIVILSGTTFRLLPYSAIISARFEGMSGRYNIGNRRAPGPETRDTLRLVSRFPQGLTPELLRRLLEANGQSELQGVNP
jgi:hypothetical protein